MPTHPAGSGVAPEAPGPARTGLRVAVGRRLPARLSLPLRARFGRSREPELALLRTRVRRGDTVVDIGAHTGVYTYWMHRQVGPQGQVLAFEPQPALHRYLAAGLARPRYSNVTLSDVALSDREGTAELTIPVVDGALQVAWAALDDPPQHAGPAAGQHVTVRTRTLDDVLDGRPVALVKCDVEGHEGRVLAGAGHVLRVTRPAWLVEIEQRHSAGGVRDTLDTFHRAGYTAHYLTAGGDVRAVPPEHLVPERLNQVEPDRYVNNFLFLPG